MHIDITVKKLPKELATEEDKYEANLIKELKVKGKPNKRSSSIKIYKNKKKQKK